MQYNVYCSDGNSGHFLFLNVSQPKYHIALPEQPVWTVLDIHDLFHQHFKKSLYRGRVAVFYHYYQYI